MDCFPNVGYAIKCKERLILRELMEYKYDISHQLIQK